MKFIQYWCFIFGIIYVLVDLELTIKKGYENCNTTAKKLGSFVGIVLRLLTEIGLVWFVFN